jgi:hypothetical protein
MLNRSQLILTWAIGAVWLMGSHAAVSKDPPAEWDGLVKREIKGLDLAYVRPDTEFPAYKKVIIDPLQVAFAKNWKAPSQYRADDLQRIKDRLSALFSEVFSKKLKAGGYSVTTTPDDEVLRISAAIADLYINAPDSRSSGQTKIYTTGTGTMLLLMELRDGVSGQLLARVVDRYTDDGNGYMRWTNSVTNRTEAERGISAWAETLVSELDKLNGKSP